MKMRLFGILMGLITIRFGIYVAHLTLHHGFWIHFALPWSIISIGAGLVLAILWAPLPSPNPYQSR